MSLQIHSDYYQTAHLYEVCRLEAHHAREEYVKAAAELADSFPRYREAHSNAKGFELAASHFKDKGLIAKMRAKFSKWISKNECEKDEIVVKRKFSSTCKQIERTYLDESMVQYRTAKAAFKDKTLARIQSGDSLADLQKDLGNLENAALKAKSWFEKANPPESEITERKEINS